jgi:retron-type reverse transcriptase
MLLNRIRPILKPLLRRNQAGFRPGKSTTAQILALRRIIDGTKDRNLTAVMVFVDFSKAFDSINHQTLFEILLAYGILKRLVEAIKLSYNSLKAKIKSPDGETEYFDIHAGVMQGDTLAPYLFVITLAYAMRQAINCRENELRFTIQTRKS